MQERNALLVIVIVLVALTLALAIALALGEVALDPALPVDQNRHHLHPKAKTMFVENG